LQNYFRKKKHKKALRRFATSSNNIWKLDFVTKQLFNFCQYFVWLVCNPNKKKRGGVTIKPYEQKLEIVCTK
jgi:hypothetical protein